MRQFFGEFGVKKFALKLCLYYYIKLTLSYRRRPPPQNIENRRWNNWVELKTVDVDLIEVRIIKRGNYPEFGRRRRLCPVHYSIAYSICIRFVDPQIHTFPFHDLQWTLPKGCLGCYRWPQMSEVEAKRHLCKKMTTKSKSWRIYDL